MQRADRSVLQILISALPKEWKIIEASGVCHNSKAVSAACMIVDTSTCIRISTTTSGDEGSITEQAAPLLRPITPSLLPLKRPLLPFLSRNGNSKS